jgi:hypothetical protein
LYGRGNFCRTKQNRRKIQINIEPYTMNVFLKTSHYRWGIASSSNETLMRLRRKDEWRNTKVVHGDRISPSKGGRAKSVTRRSSRKDARALLLSTACLGMYDAVVCCCGSCWTL